MEDIIAFVAWLVVEVVLIRPGRAVVWSASFGRWRGESVQDKEGRIYSPAGALSFRRDGQRVVTINGLLFAGVGFYVTFVFALILFAAKV